MQEDPLQGGNIHDVSGDGPEIQRDPRGALYDKYQADLIALPLCTFVCVIQK